MIRLQTDASVDDVAARNEKSVAEKDRRNEEVERAKNDDHGRHEAVRRRGRGHQELENRNVFGRPLQAARTGGRGNEVAGRTAQTAIPSDIQHAVQRLQVQSTIELCRMHKQKRKRGLGDRRRI